MATKFAVMDEGAQDVPVLDAATVMLVREGSDGPEVLMMLRNVNSDFVGGAYLFPGGAVDATDGDDEHRMVAHVAEGREFEPRVAAVREAFEEAGVLLAVDSAGAWASSTSVADWDEARRAVDTAQRTVASVCAANGLKMTLDRLAPFARWVTPIGAPRRYDTRFYVIAAPEGQEASADDRELVKSLWVRPNDALARYRAREMSLIFPTARSLMDLSEFGSVDEIVDAYRDQPEPEPIVPTLEIFGSNHHVVLPDGRRFDGDTAEPADLPT